jgi:hypothetical protein
MTRGQPASQIVFALRDASFVPTALTRDDAFWAQVEELLHAMLTRPMADVIAQEVA